LYALNPPSTSQKSDPISGSRPAPLTPDAESAIIVDTSRRFLLSAGARPRIMLVG